MGYYLDGYAVDALLDGSTWTDITPDLVGTITARYGILDNDPTARVADVGRLEIRLNNTITNSAQLVGYYTPGHANCRPGFGNGLSLRLRLLHNESEIIKFIGKIPPTGIQPDTGRYGAPLTRVTALDWIEQAANHYLGGLTMLENATAEQGIRGVINTMAAAPPGITSYHDMESVFPTVFDSVRARTTALSEIAKLVHSELGFFYLTARGLVAEGRFTRTNTLVDVSHIPKSAADSDLLHSEAGLQIITENNTSIVADQSYRAEFDNAQRDMDVSHGKHLYNSVRFVAYPRRVDASAVTLFELQNPIRLAGGASATVAGRYRDPAGGASEVSGIHMVTPVPTTHYQMWSNRDGTGTDMTASLNITVEYSTNGFTAAVSNTAAAEGWITRLRFSGRGVYLYDPLEYLAQDSASIEDYGISPLSVEMRYQNDPLVAAAWSQITLVTYRTPRLSVDSVTYIGNRSKILMGAFVYLEPGSLVTIREEVSGISGQYFVQGISFTISPGGLIEYTWILRDASVDTYAFWQLGVPRYSELDMSARLNI